MLLARLVTGRYGYLSGEEHPRPVMETAAAQGWLARLISTIFSRKRAR